MGRGTGRPGKHRLSRMDAAVDAMSMYGFPEQTVRKHIKELLKEYGGDEAWPFIEDCSYKELLDAILREQESDNLEQIGRDGYLLERALDTQQVPQDNASKEIVAVGEPVCLDTEIVAVADPVCPEPVLSMSLIDNGNFLAAEEDGNGWQDMLPDQTIEETANHMIENAPRLSEILALPPPDSVTSHPPPPPPLKSPRISEILALPPPDSVTSHPPPPPPLENPIISEILALPPPDSVPSHPPPPPPTKSPRISEILPPPDSAPSHPPPSPPPTSRRRMPSFGWIDSDEDDDDYDFIYLEPGPLVFSAKAVAPRELGESSRGARRMRKSRWDERPDDY